VFDKADRNNNGQLSREELLMLLTQQTLQVRPLFVY
jgi:hypothetical protein